MTAAELADWLGLPVARIGGLAADGHVARSGDFFELKPSVQAYVAYLTDVALDMDPAEAAELREASRRKAEAVVRSAMRELHPDREPSRE